jgi:hypothetical protein
VARPQKSPEDRRTQHVNVALSPAEIANLQTKATEAKTTVTAFVRASALDQSVIVQQSTAPDFMTRNDLRRIGNNLNQALVEFRVKNIDPPTDLLGAISKLDNLFDQWLNYEPTRSPKRS